MTAAPLLAGLLAVTAGQDAGTPERPRGMTLPEYLAQVGSANLEAAAQRLNVPIAEAQIAVAKIFPEPVLSAGVASIDVSGNGSPTSYDVGLSQTIEIGGKRGARIEVASLQTSQAKSDLQDFLRTLRANATNDFVDALHTQAVLERKEQTQGAFQRLVEVNQERLRAGDIGNVAYLQSRVEAQRFRGEVLAAEGDAETARLALGLRLGSSAGAIPVAGNLRIQTRTFDADLLVLRARTDRPDLASKRSAVDAARAKLKLAHANRWEDLTLNVGYIYSAAGSGAFLQPAFSALSFGFSIPLPLARIYNGEVDAAVAGTSQAALVLRQAELAVEIEVREALARYRAATRRVDLYTGGVLADADRVAEATLYSYQRGGATLLEVLDSQRTVNEVHLAYFDALSEHAKALVAVETSAAMWDIGF
ncbi:MAG TPA: TolC family protein [Myxococcaceae bacterium]|jgi:cobalt-zinc-cadmium efflux system outer membrane protein|nr:TolC family protein [Myxococcaceae bacterium]